MEVQYDKTVAWDCRPVIKKLTNSGSIDTENTDTAPEMHYKAGGVTWHLFQLDRTAEQIFTILALCSNKRWRMKQNSNRRNSTANTVPDTTCGLYDYQTQTIQWYSTNFSECDRAREFHLKGLWMSESHISSFKTDRQFSLGWRGGGAVASEIPVSKPWAG